MKRLSTSLDGRILRFDGVSIIDAEMVAHCLLSGIHPAQLRVTGDTWELSQFNANVAAEDEIKPAVEEPINLDFRWKMPDEYLKMDLWTRFADAYADRERDLQYNVTEENHALARMEMEYVEIQRRGMGLFMKTIIYVLDVFREKGVVWGVGRGSSCACYLLFILGLHAVDCIKYDVPMEEFFHD
jgi:DNA polymerase III alpha subunit